MNVQDLELAVTLCERTNLVPSVMLTMVAVPVIPSPVTDIPATRPVVLLLTVTVVDALAVAVRTFGSPCGPRCTQVKPLRSWKVKPL